MNFHLFQQVKAVTDRCPRDEESALQWLGGEAWVTPQPFALEPSGPLVKARAGDPLADWVPL